MAEMRGLLIGGVSLWSSEGRRNKVLIGACFVVVDEA